MSPLKLGLLMFHVIAGRSVARWFFSWDGGSSQVSVVCAPAPPQLAESLENLHIWVVGWTGELGIVGAWYWLYWLQVLSDDASRHTRHSILHRHTVNDGWLHVTSCDFLWGPWCFPGGDGEMGNDDIVEAGLVEGFVLWWLAFEALLQPRPLRDEHLDPCGTRATRILANYYHVSRCQFISCVVLYGFLLLIINRARRAEKEQERERERERNRDI